MILKFPDLATLRLALTSGAVPAAVGATPAVVGDGEGGAVWVETATSLPQAVRGELKNLGVETARAFATDIAIEVSCWAELLPLQPDPNLPDTGQQTPVLFKVPDGTVLAELVAEMLRLGNDRQGFRWLEDDKGRAEALLRVVGPPYYTLLRAVDRIGKGAAPVAFVERAPRVWVELGHTHPLAEHINPPAGKLLLLQLPRLWTLLDETPFRDVYEVLEFTLPAAPAPLSDAPPGQRIRVSPILKSGGTADGAELWVLRNGGVEELNRFVQNSDDRLLHRLAFAVGEADGRTTVVVRVRQSRQSAPVLVMNAEPYKPYLKLPNLFLPAGMRLHPPLRRDVVRQLLADDPDRVTWLTAHPDGTFTPVSLPETAFRPLADWTDYVLDRESQALQAWVQASQFDFEGFICADDQPAKPKKSPDGDRQRGDKNRGENAGAGKSEEASASAPAVKARKGTAPEPEAEPFAARVPAEPSEIQKRLKATEERFVAADGELDNPERLALWPELAALNSALGSGEDASICWMNFLWAENEVPLSAARAWFCVEAAAVPARPAAGLPKGRSWASRLSLSGEKGRDITAQELDLLLALDDPAMADLRALAAYLVYAASRTQPPEELLRRLNPVQRYLETHEQLLPVRAVWLAWSHLTRLAGNDVLGLARARDRLLGRLFSGGLRPERDLPTFLRFASEASGRRYHAARQWLTRLRDRAREWAGRQGLDVLYAGSEPRTSEYIDLVFSFGLARLGETEASRRLLQHASAVLAEQDDVHQVLLAGFRYRIEQALAGKPHGGPLPGEQLEYLEMLPKKPRDGHVTAPRYVVERMRALSFILEPDQRVKPYRHVIDRRDGDLSDELARLQDVLDVRELAARVSQLLRKPPKGASSPLARAQILHAGLDQAPRVSEEFARELLDQVAAVYDSLGKTDNDTLTARAQLLEKALFVAAHFDRAEQIPHLVGRFEKLVEAQGGDGLVTGIETLANQCFRGLRKLGMRDEIDRLLTLIAAAVLQGQPLTSLDGRSDKTAALRALLHVAEGWYYFGRDSRAEPVVQAARTALFGGASASSALELTKLACVYAATVGQAQVEVARRRLEELFDKLTNVRDTYTTNPHYSQSQIQVVEAVVLAVVSEDFTLGSQARRWLDDDEFLVRRRIHRDVRELMSR
jgi:cellulose synthase operon protein C